MNITLRQLHAFVMTAQLGSVTRAAERLHLTQSAVSMLIKQLETNLGVRLFDRTTRSLRLTIAASEALPIVERMLRNEEQLIAEVRGLADRGRGHVRMAVTAAFAAGMMPEILNAFRQQFPNIGITMLDVSPEQLVPKVVNEEVEFSIGTTIDDIPSDVVCACLLRDTMAAVVLKDSPISSMDSLSWEDVVSFPIVAIRKGMGIRSVVDGTLALKGKVLEPAWEVSLLSTALAMVAAGLGVAILPPYLVSCMHYAALTSRPLIDPVVTREVSVITKAGRTLSCAAESFLDVTRHMIAKP